MSEPNGAGGRLLISYDGSDDAKHAIESAGSLFPGRSCVVLTAWQPITALTSYTLAGGPMLPENAGELDKQVEDAACRTAEEGAELARSAGLDAEARIVESDGPIWRSILRAAGEQEAAAVVMGPRGLSGVKSALLGSVSHGVVQHAERPVVIVPRVSGR